VLSCAWVRETVCGSSEAKADGQDNNVKPEEVEGFKRMLQVVVPIGVGLVVIWKVVSRTRAQKPPAGSTTVNVT